MELFKKTNIDFMGARLWTALLSLVFFVASIAVLATDGLHLGLDFTGGTQIELAYKQPANIAHIRQSLLKAGFDKAVVQSYGTSEDVVVNIAPQEDLNQIQLVNKVMAALPGAEKRRVDYVGPQVGKELATKGLLAILVSLIGTMIYIAMRFEYRFAVSAAVALIHDPLLILGIFSYFDVTFDLKALAAILAVIGYSLNDTIVVFDRVRENFRKVRRSSPITVMNLSINETLSRTIMTSALTLVVVIVLFLYGGETIHGFSLAFIIGIVFGTYSSIYVAGSLAIALGLSKKDLMPVSREVLDDRP